MEKLKEELHILYTLSDYMHKDPLYQNRCAPYSDPKFSLFWDKIHMKILELEEKLGLFQN
jgi:hypothetical protein